MTSGGRSSGRSRRRRASTRSTSSSGPTGPSSSSTLDTIAAWSRSTSATRTSTAKPVLPQLLDAMVRSAKLAGLALFITIPLGIAAGLYAARRRDRPTDRGDRAARRDLVVDPGVRDRRRSWWSSWGRPQGSCPSSRPAAERRRPRPRSSTCSCPRLAMAIVYFGYIARMTRAGTIEVLQSDYTRTATMKGLTTSQIMRRHVLRNALIPTVAVIAVQVGYLFGGIIAVEKIFNYNGMGQTMLFAAQRKDIPMLTAGVHHHRHRLHARDARRRHDHRLDEPADPTGRGTLMDVIGHSTRAPSRPLAARRGVGAPQARRETLALLLRRPAFIIGNMVIIGWIICAVLGERDHPVRPVQRLRRGSPAAQRRAPDGHRPAGPRRAVAGHGRLARRPDRRAAGRAARRRRRDAPRSGHGLLPRRRRRRPQPDRRGIPGPAGHPRRPADARRARARRRSW